MQASERQNAELPLRFNLGITEVVPGFDNAPDADDDDTLLHSESGLSEARTALDDALSAVAKRHGRCPSSLADEEFRRAYMDALWKVNTLIKQDEAKHNAQRWDGHGQQQGLINVGCCNRGIRDRNRPAATCMALSALVSGVFLALAVLYQVGAAAWVNGSYQDLESLRDLGYKKFEGDDALYYDVVAARGTTCTVERRWAGEHVLEDFWGWADDSGFEPPVKNYGIKHVWCGLMLGVVFGFLDNFGLFYGLDALNDVFYATGYRVALNVMELAGANHLESFERKRRPTGLLLAYNAHVITEGLMSGLGNTFSDLLGVLLGTAALEIAKAGLGVNPSLWALDLFAVVLGCLMGAFLPVLIKEQRRFGGISHNARLANLGGWGVICLFLSVFAAGIPVGSISEDLPVSLVLSFALMLVPVAVLVSIVCGCAACCGRRGGRGGRGSTTHQSVRDVIEQASAARFEDDAIPATRQVSVFFWGAGQ